MTDRKLLSVGVHALTSRICDYEKKLATLLKLQTLSWKIIKDGMSRPGSSQGAAEGGWLQSFLREEDGVFSLSVSLYFVLT